ncbi:acyltransferase family protein [Planctomicrobium sp. SH661]|uniref:acyltransferase family protein n=1 Tax=Planctomicrobium sp. SH661 TaxID=3448124 RepID=UPI003F5AF0FF
MNPIIFFWFLPTLFLIYTLLPIFQRLLKTRVSAMVGIVLLSAIYILVRPPQDPDSPLRWLNISGVLQYSIYFYMGLLLQRNLSGTPRNLAALLSIGLLIVSVTAFAAGAKNFPPTALPLAAVGIAWVYSICLTPLGDNRFFQFLGRYSFQIYLLSWFPQALARILFSQILRVNIGVNVFLSLFLGIAVPIAITVLLDRYLPKKIAFLYGR